MQILDRGVGIGNAVASSLRKITRFDEPKRVREVLDNRGFTNSFGVMPLSVEKILQEARDLPPVSLADLVEKLIETMEANLSVSDEGALLEEVDRRRKAVEAGTVSLIPEELALQRGRDAIGG